MNYVETQQIQMDLCREYGRVVVPCAPDSKLGLALRTISPRPIHGLRHPPTETTNGWYIWAGDYSSKTDFFEPLHTSHLSDRLPQVIRFLGLPPGSRFLWVEDHAEVWFDEALLHV